MGGYSNSRRAFLKTASAVAVSAPFISFIPRADTQTRKSDPSVGTGEQTVKALRNGGRRSLFCLVHGSTQSAEGWRLLISELEKRGHLTLTINLPTTEPQASATRYADVIVQALDQTKYDIGDMVVVAHSASGMFLPLVAAQRPIRHMVFLAALVPKIGTSILDQFRTDRSMFNPEWVGKNPVEDDDVARRFLFHDCAPGIIDWALKTRRLMHAKEAMAEVCPLKNWPSVKGSYVVCTQDRVISPAWSRRIAKERLGSEPIELVAGHCPHVSRPAELADILIREPIVKSRSASFDMQQSTLWTAKVVQKSISS
jgi:pimeloyl-ACP methyl ester carboxylesterase